MREVLLRENCMGCREVLSGVAIVPDLKVRETDSLENM
jgi:hypothetical protein